MNIKVAKYRNEIKFNLDTFANSGKENLKY